MNLIKQKIQHNSLGRGTVVQQDAGSITVKFATKTSKFIYPDAFTAFIRAEDAAVQAVVVGEMDAARAVVEAREQEKLAAIEAVKREEEESRVAAKVRKAARAAAPKKTKAKKPATENPSVGD